MSPTQIYNIARREYIARVRNKWFIISTLLVPLFMIMPLAMTSLLQRADIDELRLAVVDVDTGYGETIAADLADVSAFQVVVTESVTTDAAGVATVRENLAARIVAEEDLDAYLLLEPDDELLIRARYYARETGNIVINQTLERTIRAVALANYLEGSGLDAEQVNALIRWDLDTVTVSSEGEEEGGFERAYLSTLMLAMVLYITVLMGGQQMGTSIIEEKTSRLIEIVLGAVTATEFMAGKIAGVLAAALTQLAIWISLGLLISLYALPMLAMGASMGGFDITEYFDLGLIGYFAIFFVLGYLLYSVMYAAAASTCSNSEEFQQIAFPLVMPMVISLMFTFYVITNPAATISRIISFIPLATPLVMLARINVLRPPTWEIWASILLLAATSWVVVLLAAKIFRFSLLMQGKRPSLGTVFRLMRAA